VIVPAIFRTGVDIVCANAELAANDAQASAIANFPNTFFMIVLR
jgi:hypothetical protein